MVDKSFEEQVRGELLLLRIIPEAEVWGNIASALHKEKKRRWIIWFVFLLGIAGAGSFFVFKQFDKTQNILATKNVSAPKQQTVLTDSVNTLEEGKKNGTGNRNRVATNKAVVKLPAKQGGADGQMKNSWPVRTASGKHNVDQARPDVNPKNPVTGIVTGHTYHTDEQVKNSSLVTNASGKHNADQTLPDISKKVSKENIVPGKPYNTKNTGNTVLKNNLELVEVPNNKKKADSLPVMASQTMDLTNKPTKKDSTGASGYVMGMDTTVPSVKKKEHGWAFFFTGTTGVSGLANSLRNSYANYNNASYNPATPGSVSNGLLQPVPNYTNRISFGISFEAKKQLTRKSSIGFGLGYQFCQAAVSVGSRIDSTVTINLINGTNDHGFYYQDGGNNRYRNHYHFLDLSVLFYLQNKAGDQHPFRWKFGMGTGLLIESNALLYDPSSNRLFQKNSLLNKVMLNSSVGFDKGIGNPVFLYIGPQLSYSVSRLSGINNTAPQHLFRASVNISVPILKKKSKMQR